MEFLPIFVIILYVIGTLLHLFGCYMLYQVRRRALCKTPITYLLNLSFSEVLLSITGCVRRILFLSGISKVATYITMFQWTTFTIGYFLAMILLTIDRFLAVYLNLRYHLYWSEKKAITTIAIAWLLSILFGITVQNIVSMNIDNIITFATIYYLPLVEVIVLLIAILTYGYFYKQMQRHKRQRPSVSRSETTKQNTAGEVQVKEKHRTGGFYVPALIMITFVVFIILPDQVYFFTTILNVKIPDYVVQILSLAYIFAYISDGMIYIFLSVPVRRRMSAMWKRR